MNYEPDDPRLTAYALNELDEASNREIEAHLQEDPEARRMVEEIRATSALLSSELKKESAPKLHAGQRAAIQNLSRSGARKTAPKPAVPLRTYRPFVAAVAALLLVSVTMFWFTASQNAPRVAQLKAYGYKNTPSEPHSEADEHVQLATKYDDAKIVSEKSSTPHQNEAGGGAVGAELDDVIGVGGISTSGTGGGWGAGNGSGNKKTSNKPGDNFETINLDRPDSHSASGNPDSGNTSRKRESSMLADREAKKKAGEETPALSLGYVAADNDVADRVTFSDQVIISPPQKEVTKSKSEYGLKNSIEEISRTLPAAVSAPPMNPVENKPQPVVVTARVEPAKIAKPAELTLEQDQFKNEVKKISPVATPAKIMPVEPPRESVVATIQPPVSTPEKILAGRVSLLSDEGKKESKKPSARPLNNHVLPVTETPVSGPAAPLNPLGYATPETKKPEIPLRYAPPQYQSYIQPTYNLPQSSEEYARVNDNTFRDTNVLEHRLSTFSADVDTAAYSNVRRFINQGQLPPADAVRIEEMVNYFKYDYTAPKDGKPFHVFMELAQCPWNPNHKLARIGVKAAEIEKNQRPASNLVFLIDVSGSMESEKKLPLVKQGLTALVENLNDNDRVSIVTYASGTTLALPSTPCNQKGAIINAIRKLHAAGSTNGGDGIQRAYQQAAENFLRGGVNRVILATDGDFNVGITDQAQLTELIEAKAKEGVFLTVLGYGMGNLKDAKLELLADKGNGNYAYIDTDAESRRVLVDQMSGTLVTVAKDVKFQVEFNPSRVRAHRLVGYENRILAHADFKNDAKDAGEIGAGHIVTALYEIVPTRNSVALPGTDPLRYLPADAEATQLAQSEELLMLKIRYKLHNQDTSSLLEFPVQDNATSYGKASKDFKFSAAVAGFGMLLRGSPYRGNSTFESILELGGECVNGVPERKEFIELVQKARDLRR